CDYWFMIDADLSRYAQQLWIQGIFSARYSYQIDDLFAQMLFVLSQPGFCGHIHCSPMGNRDRRLAVMRFCR
ncbi:hypothetical protein N4K11_RS26585, partial [Escherichia coli]